MLLSKFHIGSLLSRAFSLACEHQVKIESNFISVMLGIMVLEGLGRSLDPELDLMDAALPLILRDETLSKEKVLEVANSLSWKDRMRLGLKVVKVVGQEQLIRAKHFVDQTNQKWFGMNAMVQD